MKDFTSYGKKELRNACILSDDQFKLIDEVKGFFSLELHESRRYAVMTLERPNCNPRNSYLLMDLELRTSEPVEGVKKAKQIIRERCLKQPGANSGLQKGTDPAASTFTNSEGGLNALQTNKKKAADAMAAIPRPSCEELEKYLERWRLNPELFVPELVLNKLFTHQHPLNQDIEEIVLKVAALNTIYSTQIFSVYPIAKRILSLQIDERLRAGDESLVQEIMSVDYMGKIRHINHYSFASKYCSFHNPEAYPIFDSYVEKVLLYYQKKDGFYSFSKEDLKDYGKFKHAIYAFRDYYGLNHYTVKQLDQFLWQFGKDYF